MTTAIDTQRAVLYLRVSSTGQVGERHSSLQTQEEHCRAHCESLGASVVKKFTDVVSGRRDDRPQYVEMVEFLRSGGADLVVVQFLDRFGRNDREILRRWWELDERGVKVVASDEPEITSGLVLNMKASLASMESDRNSERSRSNMRKRAERGVQAARAPFGLMKRYKGQDFVWEIDPGEGPIVREMGRLAVEENLGFKGIADRLNADGHRGREGRTFGSDSIRRYLNNEAIAGTFVWGKKPRTGNAKPEEVRIEDNFPAILSRDEWDQLQERLAIRRKHSRGPTHKSTYLLSGIARCGTCEGPMVGKAGAERKDGTKYRNYWCSRAQKSRDACPTYNGNATQKLEDAVLKYLSRYEDPKLVEAELAAAESKEVEGRGEELKRVDTALSDVHKQFMKQMDMAAKSIITDEEFEEANIPIRLRRDSLRERRQELLDWISDQESRQRAAVRLPERIGRFLEVFTGLPVQQQKAQLQGILDAVHVHRDGLIEVEFRT